MIEALAVFATVIVPPLEMMVAELLTRSSAASAEIVFVRLMPPPLSVMPVVLSRAWLRPASLSVWPTLIVVVPLQPPVLVPWNVRTLLAMPPSTPPVSVMFPEPLTAPVIVCNIAVVGVAVAALLSVMLTVLADPSDSVFAPVLIV